MPTCCFCGCEVKRDMVIMHQGKVVCRECYAKHASDPVNEEAEPLREVVAYPRNVPILDTSSRRKGFEANIRLTTERVDVDLSYGPLTLTLGERWNTISDTVKELANGNTR